MLNTEAIAPLLPEDGWPRFADGLVGATHPTKKATAAWSAMTAAWKCNQNADTLDPNSARGVIL